MTLFRTPGPRLFGLPPGVDFPSVLVGGLLERMEGQPPEALARVELFVNTRRTQRRLREVFDAGPSRLLPRIRLLTDLADDPSEAALPLPVPKLRRRLELAQLVSQLLEAQPDLAPRAALYDLSDSLARLMDEMQGEGVPVERIADLDVSDQSGHWARSLQFISIVGRYFDLGEAPDVEARQRLATEALIDRWERAPPRHPVIVAGSTGSRGTTARLMDAVARLPQGAVVLPGFDFDLPQHLWPRLDSEDHPQYRFARLMEEAGIGPQDVRRWSEHPPGRPARNRLVSLSLRPAPVTDQWLSEGGDLGDLRIATEGMTLVEAPGQRAEAVAIALRLRQAAQDGTRAALITPDRMLTRRVAAALSRWGITPDDSAGIPLPLSAPGRLLRHVADLFGKKITAEALLTILKHPLVGTGNADRGDHLRWTRELELKFRSDGPPYPEAETLRDWAAGKPDNERRLPWADWVAGVLLGHEKPATRPLADHLARHIAVAEALSAGVGGLSAGGLWEEAAGREAQRICDELGAEAAHGGEMATADYRDLFNAVLNEGEVREGVEPTPGILIWGTLEARVQGAELLILGGLNEGVWPAAASPDPWLNRAMRKAAGLLLPERQIGLSAHDYQQAIAAPEVWLTRALRSEEAETVPSRWLNRLVNLLNGLPETHGKAALGAMKARGDEWLELAEAVEAPRRITPPAPRPSPCPPVEARPKRLSVTRIKTLIRDPYAIYAERILRLRALDPLDRPADAPLRGIAVHEILDRFVREGIDEDHATARARLLQVADEVMRHQAPWPTIRTLWIARLRRVSDWFLREEAQRRRTAVPAAFEVRGRLSLDGLGFTLTGVADRIDRTPEGAALIYDYKTGAPPTPKLQQYFDKQLLLEAAMVERGGFEDIGEAPVAGAAYIGLGSNPRTVPAPLDRVPAAQVWEELHELIAAWADRDRGYTARMTMQSEDRDGYVDHLSRYGEWDHTTPANKEQVG